MISERPQLVKRRERPKLARRLPHLVKRRAGIVNRVDTGNKSVNELANRMEDKIKLTDNLGDVFCKMKDTIEEMKEEKNTGVDQTEDETKRTLVMDDKVLITPKAYVTEKPESRYNIFGEDKEPDYCNGGEGCIQWINDTICAPIYPPGEVTSHWTPMNSLPSEINPETGKSYEMMWWTQQEILRDALAMNEHKLFKHRNIVFCWQRGEGKSYLACLIQLWKFYNWLRQQIMLGANSKDQIKFVHFDIMRDIIFNSPVLFNAVGGKKNIQEKEIRFVSGGNIRSIIRSISSFSGIVSNITGYTFSEIFDMKKPKFYTQLDGSIRNVPNAFGVVDSTVSDKTHLLYQQYSSFVQGKIKTLFFSYRCSKTGDPEDYMHPYMTRDQLDDYREKFPFGEFERYFLNTWEAGRSRLFDDFAIEAIKIIGYQGGVMNMPDVFEAMKRKMELKDMAAANQKRGFESDYPVQRIMEIENSCRFISDFITFGNNGMATFKMIEDLTEFFDTYWVLLAGIDLGDPLAIRGQARSILSLNLKGLIGSRTNPYEAQLAEAAPKWLYIKVGLFHIEGHSLDSIKQILDYANDEFDGIDMLACERYGAWDVGTWCEDRQIEFEPIYPNYDRQKVAFKELYLAIKEGRMKCPTVPIFGSKNPDIYREELEIFDHDLEKKAFGSPEKFEKGGIQDDTIYADAWSLYGGRDKGLDDFRIRRNEQNFGFCYNDKSMIGNYQKKNKC